MISSVEINDRVIWKERNLLMPKRKLEATDLFKLHSITNPVIAPNGKEAVFIRTEMNEKDNKYYAYLHHVNLETELVTQWTYSKDRISSPQWSADGKHVAFLSNRDEENQIYVLPTSGGEAKKLTNVEKGITSFIWSPCGKKVWFDASLKEGKSWTDKVEKDEKKLPEAYVVEKMKYHADGAGLLPKDTYKQIGWIDISSEEITQFTKGNFHHSLQAISHDGEKLVIGVNRDENQDFSFHQPMILVDVETKKKKLLSMKMVILVERHFQRMINI